MKETNVMENRGALSEMETVIYADNVKLREDGQAVIIIDQSLLPNETRYIELDTPKKMYDAIFHLRVRGAPAIGICAAYCMAVLAAAEAARLKDGAVHSDGFAGGFGSEAKAFDAKAGHSGSAPDRVAGGNSSSADGIFLETMKRYGDYLKSSRPTAVNLAWAVDRVLAAAQAAMQTDCGVCDESGGRAAHAHGNDAAYALDNDAGHADHVQHTDASCAHLAEAIKQEAIRIHREDIVMCKAISEYGLTLVQDGDGILTHCNAGPLATSRYGTALGPILLGKERGMNFKVFADETRPLLQGARLTAYELQKAGVDVTLICDNMASMVMKNGWIKACFVGCDRVAANGDTANKIGTSGVAILAKHYGIPFYVLGPVSTIDLDCPSGAAIPIELRQPQEIKEKFYQTPMALPEVKCYNPAFDVTDHRLITAIVTDKGICRPPFTESLRRVKTIE